MGQYFLYRSFAHSGDFQQFAGKLPSSSRAVESDREAMRFVADLLHQMKHRRVMVEHDGIALAAQHVQDFFLLGDRRQWLIDDLDLLESCRGRVQLADSTVDQYQVGCGLLLLLQAPIATPHDFLHARKVIVLGYRLDDELAVVGLLHSPVFADHHGRYDVGTLNVGHVEALDAAGRLGQVERLGQALDHLARVRFEDAESPLEGVTGVAGHELEQGAPSSTLRRQDLDLPAPLFGQEFFQDCAVLKVHRGVNLVGQILLIEVDLLQE